MSVPPAARLAEPGCGSAKLEAAPSSGRDFRAAFPDGVVVHSPPPSGTTQEGQAITRAQPSCREASADSSARLGATAAVKALCMLLTAHLLARQ